MYFNRLNSRQHIARKAAYTSDHTDWNSIPMGGISNTGGSTAVGEESRVRVIVTKQSGNDSEFVRIYMHTFSILIATYRTITRPQTSWMACFRKFIVAENICAGYDDMFIVFFSLVTLERFYVSPS